MEGLGDIWIHLDEELLLLCQLLVADGNFISSPGAEWLPQDGVGDVDEPLARDLVHVSVVGQIGEDGLVLAGFIEDGGDGEVLVLRAVKDFDFFALDAARGLAATWATYYFFLPPIKSLRK